MTAICICTGNNPLEFFLPIVAESAQTPTNTFGSLQTLTLCISMQNVDSPSLAALFSVLSHYLDVHVEAVIRTRCLIVDDMFHICGSSSRGDHVQCIPSSHCPCISDGSCHGNLLFDRGHYVHICGRPSCGYPGICWDEVGVSSLRNGEAPCAHA